jgi:LacI family transcriptional regulator
MVVPKKRITILDIARAVGVTDGTVSRALAGDARVKPETREKVLAAARSLGYRPNLAARFFKQGQTRTIGVIMEFGYWLFYNQYFGRLLAGLADAAREDDRRLTFFFPQIEPSLDRVAGHDLIHPKGFEELFDGRVDGAVVFAGQKLGEATLNLLHEVPVPVVLLNTNQVLPGFAQLASGAGARTKAAALALFDRGHRKLGMLGLYPDTPYEWSTRLGLIEAYEARGFEFHPKSLVPVGHWDVSNPEELTLSLDKLLEQGITGLICSESAQMIVALELLKRRGIRVPEQVSVLGFGPLPHGIKLLDPWPSLFNTDLIEGGRETYRLLKDASEGKPVRTVELDWKLSEGQTLAPPPKEA